MAAFASGDWPSAIAFWAVVFLIGFWFRAHAAPGGIADARPAALSTHSPRQTLR